MSFRLILQPAMALFFGVRDRLGLERLLSMRLMKQRKVSHLWALETILMTVFVLARIQEAHMELEACLGDINIFNLFLFKAGGVELGVGPQLTMASATNHKLGTDRWQLGGAGVVISPHDWGLLGALVTPALSSSTLTTQTERRSR